MSVSFIFNKLKSEDLSFYVDKSNVFNMKRGDIEKEKILLASYSDDTLGASEEKLDIAIYRDGVWELQDIEKKIKGYNEIPLGYILPKDSDFTRILIILRRMSNMILDSVKEGFSSYIYCVADSRYHMLEEDKALFGLLAKNRIFLDVSEEEVKQQIKENITDRNAELISRLF